MEETILKVKMLNNSDDIKFTFNNTANSKEGREYATEIMKAIAICLDTDNLEYGKMQTDKGMVNLLK